MQVGSISKFGQVSKKMAKAGSANGTGAAKKVKVAATERQAEAKAPVASTSAKTLEEFKVDEQQEEDEESKDDEDDAGDAGEVAVEEEEEKPAATFESLGLIPQICEACALLNFKAPTAIQAET